MCFSLKSILDMPCWNVFILHSVLASYSISFLLNSDGQSALIEKTNVSLRRLHYIDKQAKDTYNIWRHQNYMTIIVLFATALVILCLENRLLSVRSSGNWTSYKPFYEVLTLHSGVTTVCFTLFNITYHFSLSNLHRMKKPTKDTMLDSTPWCQPLFCLPEFEPWGHLASCQPLFTNSLLPPNI